MQELRFTIKLKANLICIQTVNIIVYLSGSPCVWSSVQSARRRSPAYHCEVGVFAVAGFHGSSLRSCSEARDLRYRDEGLQFANCGFREFEFCVVSPILVLSSRPLHQFSLFQKGANGYCG